MVKHVMLALTIAGLIGLAGYARAEDKPSHPVKHDHHKVHHARQALHNDKEKLQQDRENLDAERKTIKNDLPRAIPPTCSTTSSNSNRIGSSISGTNPKPAVTGANGRRIVTNCGYDEQQLGAGPPRRTPTARAPASSHGRPQTKRRVGSVFRIVGFPCSAGDTNRSNRTKATLPRITRPSATTTLNRPGVPEAGSRWEADSGRMASGNAAQLQKDLQQFAVDKQQFEQDRAETEPSGRSCPRIAANCGTTSGSWGDDLREHAAAKAPDQGHGGSTPVAGQRRLQDRRLRWPRARRRDTPDRAGREWEGGGLRW